MPTITSKIQVEYPPHIAKLSWRARFEWNDCFMEWWRRIPQEDQDKYLALVEEESKGEERK